MDGATSVRGVDSETTESHYLPVDCIRLGQFHAVEKAARTPSDSAGISPEGSRQTLDCVVQVLHTAVTHQPGLAVTVTIASKALLRGCDINDNDEESEQEEDTFSGNSYDRNYQSITAEIVSTDFESMIIEHIFCCEPKSLLCEVMIKSPADEEWTWSDEDRQGNTHSARVARRGSSYGRHSFASIKD